MTEGAFTRLSRSVFAKFATIMLVTALTLVMMVTGFFAFVIFPTLTLITRNVVHEYARMLAATSPGIETAKDLRKRIYVQVRYEGPSGAWTTDESVPSIEQVRRNAHMFAGSRQYDLEPAPDGGTYLFTWDIGEVTREAHVRLLWLLALLTLAVVFIAYQFQKQLLRPLRSLSEGVARLSANDLSVTLPVTTRDEFGSLTEAFNKMVGRVREMIQTRDQLLLDVSHELRSPITRMKVALELADDNDIKAGMTADLNEMEAMISELLELERLREGRGVRCERQDLVPILREAVRNFEGFPPGVRITDVPDTLFLDVDGEKIRTVLRNLLDNAIKYSLLDSRPIEISAEQHERQIVVRVSDNGPGIPESDIPNLFEPFFRVDRSRSKKTGGYGLGLSICKRIMEAHGGYTRVENNPARGATFVLTFEVSPDL